MRTANHTTRRDALSSELEKFETTMMDGVNISQRPIAIIKNELLTNDYDE